MATPTSFVRRGRRFRASAREDVREHATDASDDASRDASVDDDGGAAPGLRLREQRFARELAVLSRCQHANLLGFLGYSTGACDDRCLEPSSTASMADEP